MKPSLVSFMLAALSMTAPASFGQPLIEPPSPGQPLPARYEVIPYSGSASDALKASLAGATIPMGTFSINATKDNQPYTNTIVGTYPTTAITTTVDVVVVPLIISIQTPSGSVTFDPIRDKSCMTGFVGPDLATLYSPVFVNNPLIMNGVSVGSTQYLDAFRRAEFATVGGLNNNYHTLLNLAPRGSVTITVPAPFGAVFFSGCGTLGVVNYNVMDFFVRGIMNNAGLATALGIKPTNFPIFLTKNVVMSSSIPPNLTACCILGYHSAFNPSFAASADIQTYAVAAYDTTGDFGLAVQDISALSHEVGEWMDDPLGTNPTPRYGTIGQVPACPDPTTGGPGGSTLLEVGDPLSGKLFPPIFNYDSHLYYHPQELAFFSWFYNANGVASLGAGGFFSNNQTFMGPSKTCPGGGTW